VSSSPRTRSAIENTDVAAATFVVGKDLQVADFLSIPDAVVNLPTEGGKIVCLEGTFVNDGTVELSDKPVEIEGCGVDATILSMPTFVGPMFKVLDGLSTVREYAIRDLSVQGGSVAGQEFFAFDDASGFGDCLAENIKITEFETIVHWIKYDTSYSRQTTFWLSYSSALAIVGDSILCKTPNPAGSYFAAVAMRISNSPIRGQFTGGTYYGWDGDADADLYFFEGEILDLVAGASFNGLADMACNIRVIGDGDLTFYGNGWDIYDFTSSNPDCLSIGRDGAFSATGARVVFYSSFTFLQFSVILSLAIKCTGLATISVGFDADVTGITNPGIEIAPARVNEYGSVVYNSTFKSILTPPTVFASGCIKITNAQFTKVSTCTFVSSVTGDTVIDSGTSDKTVIDNCTGLENGTGPTLAASTKVDGALQAAATEEATTDAYATVFTHENPKGLLGIGTVKNIGAIAATGSIIFPPPDVIATGATITIDDGTNPATIFEFTRGGAPAPGNVAINLVGAVTDNDVRDLANTAINGAPGLAVTSSTDGDATIDLVNDTPGSAGNQTITNFPNGGSGLGLTGMSGGLDGNDMDVRETVTDAFGVTDTYVTTPIVSGDFVILNPQAQKTSALPPYVSYKVEVKSTTPGSPTAYSLRHTSQGALT
jgi:hypothetical protein